MPILYTGNDADGRVAYANGQFWITQDNETLSNIGIAFDFDIYDNVTYVVEGNVTSDDDAIESDGAGGGNYNTLVVKKDAKVVGASDGVDFYGNSNTVINHGVIKGGDDEGVQFNDDGGSLVNLGKIKGGNNGLYNVGDAGSFYNGEGGLIKGGSFGAYLNADGGGLHLENDGVIKGGVGIDAVNGTHQISNNGTIEGTGGTAIQGDAGIQNIYNSGEIIGDVELGAGNDAYDGRKSGEVDGTVYGEAGSDVLRGGKHNDKLDGGADGDSIYGGNGNDNMWGGDSGDYLAGGKGNDKIRGDAGNDWIQGEKGDDQMWGGADADDFYFFKSKEGNDVIKDWEDGSDQIWLDYGITNTAKFLNKGVTTDGADVLVDLAWADNAGGDTAEGIIRIKGAAGDIGLGDFVFI